MQEKFKKALEELRKERKRNFNQTVELIINLKDFDIKRENINVFVQLPFHVKEKKICAFLTHINKVFDFCITKQDFPKWQDKKDTKKLVKKYDFFVSLAALMPAVATTFGKILGSAGKMPSPQLGILQNEDEKSMLELKEKIMRVVRIRTKEKSIKIAIGKEDMDNDKLSENALAIYNAVFAALPKKKENIKSIMLKLTMSKPIKIKL